MPGYVIETEISEGNWMKDVMSSHKLTALDKRDLLAGYTISPPPWHRPVRRIDWEERRKQNDPDIAP